MAANTPTVLYLKSAFWPICHDAEPYFEKLKAVGIFHTNPVSAALHVNKIFEDVGAWWLSKQVQIARREWIENFARTSPNWRRRWLQTISRI